MISSGSALTKVILTSVFVICFMTNALSADPESESDSIPKSVLVISPRLNSTGYFPFTGAYLNNHFNGDINIFYDRKAWGFFLFQSRDFEDERSYVNYFQPGIFKNFNVDPKLKLRLFFGYIFSQTDGFKDKDSDYYAALSEYWDVTKKIRVENTTLFFDLGISKKVANRLLVSYTIKKFKVDLFVWQRYVFENGFAATSASLALNFPKLKLSEKTAIQTTFSYQRYLTDAKPDFAMRDGFLFQVAVPVTLVKY